MKFGKSLSNQIEDTLPEWRDKFLSYKELKKRLKLIEPKRHSAAPSASSPPLNGEGAGSVVAPAPKKLRLDSGVDRAAIGGGGERPEKMTEAEIDFVKLLEDELEKFNSFFVEQEEEYIIRLKVDFFSSFNMLLFISSLLCMLLLIISLGDELNSSE